MGKKGNQLERSENQRLQKISICIFKQNKRVFFYGEFVSITRIERKRKNILYTPSLPVKKAGVKVASSTIIQHRRRFCQLCASSMNKNSWEILLEYSIEY